MAEFKMPENPYHFKKGAIKYLIGSIAIGGGLWAMLSGGKDMDGSIAHNRGVAAGALAMGDWYQRELDEAKKCNKTDNKEEESP